MRWALRLTLLLTGLPVVLVLVAGLSAIGEIHWQRALWEPPLDFGVLGVMLGTVLAAGLGSAAALYLGYGCGVQIAYHGRSARPIALLAATPAVLLGAALIGPLRPVLLQIHLGEGVLLAAAGLALLGLPDAAYAARDAAHALIWEFRSAIALGLTADEALGAVGSGVRRALLRSWPLVFGRLAGEATLTSLLIGNAGGWPALSHPSGALAPLLLSEVLQAPPGGAWQHALSAVAAIVLLMGLVPALAMGGGRHAHARG